jgi:endonuclease YncB( thermonuclease family)
VLRLLGIPIIAAVALALLSVPTATSAPPAVYRVSRVIDGDTIELGNGQRVRLVQIDTPEVYNGYECYGQEASTIAKHLLPAGTHVLLQLEPASDPVDRYGRLLRYVINARDGVNVNLRLVAVGAAAPWFYDGEHGRYSTTLQTLAKEAKLRRLGLWGACPRTVYDPYHAVTTQR